MLRPLKNIRTVHCNRGDAAPGRIPPPDFSGSACSKVIKFKLCGKAPESLNNAASPVKLLSGQEEPRYRVSVK